jgi:hypothetical protein
VDEVESRFVRDWRQLALAATGKPLNRYGRELFYFTFGKELDELAYSQRTRRAIRT